MHHTAMSIMYSKINKKKILKNKKINFHKIKTIFLAVFSDLNSVLEISVNYNRQRQISNSKNTIVFIRNSDLNLQ